MVPRQAGALRAPGPGGRLARGRPRRGTGRAPQSRVGRRGDAGRGHRRRCSSRQQRPERGRERERERHRRARRARPRVRDGGDDGVGAQAPPHAGVPLHGRGRLRVARRRPLREALAARAPGRRRRLARRPRRSRASPARDLRSRRALAAARRSSGRRMRASRPRRDRRRRIPACSVSSSRSPCPFGYGEQAPLLGEGVPALRITTAPDGGTPPGGDELAGLDAGRLARLGRASELLLTSLDAAVELPSTTDGALYLGDRAVRGWALELLLLAAVVPFAGAALDLLSRCRRRRLRPRSRVAGAAPEARRLARRRRRSSASPPRRARFPPSRGSRRRPTSRPSTPGRVGAVTLGVLVVALVWLRARARLIPRARARPEEDLGAYAVAFVALLLVAARDGARLPVRPRVRAPVALRVAVPPPAPAGARLDHRRRVRPRPDRPGARARGPRRAARPRAARTALRRGARSRRASCRGRRRSSSRRGRPSPASSGRSPPGATRAPSGR